MISCYQGILFRKKNHCWQIVTNFFGWLFVLGVSSLSSWLCHFQVVSRYLRFRRRSQTHNWRKKFEHKITMVSNFFINTTQTIDKYKQIHAFVYFLRQETRLTSQNVPFWLSWQIKPKHNKEKRVRHVAKVEKVKKIHFTIFFLSFNVRF